MRGRVDVQAAALACAGACISGLGVLLAGHALPEGARGAASALILAAICVGVSLAARHMFRRVSNPDRRELANSDRLTRLKSRNAFEVDVDNLDARGRKRGMCVAVMDLDNLKGVNDALGHVEGDRCLRMAADALSALMRGEAWAYRVGGDEFVVLAEGLTEEELTALCRAVQARYAGSTAGMAVATGLSVGWALFDPERDVSLRDTYHRADRRMYVEKQSRGRADPQ